jgi:epoxyqueuosine reductase
MDYLARDPTSRYDARLLLPECRSVIVLALSYFSGDRSGDSSAPARVARYAWGEDYHAVLRDKAEQLGRWMDDRVPQHRYRVTVDSAPLAEKAFAVASGVGWRGRNTLVLNERLGSYFMLACLLSSAELSPDVSATDRCGSCRRCIDSCPTHALAAPGVLDARLCISYWTTSSKQPPPRAEMLQGWLAGCDLCQQACPYNAAPAATREPRFAPVTGLPILQPAEIMQMSEADFQQRFGQTVLADKGLPRLRAIAKLLLGKH